jgi:hypothetical protein
MFSNFSTIPIFTSNQTLTKKLPNKYHYSENNADSEVQRSIYFVGHRQEEQRKFDEAINSIENDVETVYERKNSNLPEVYHFRFTNSFKVIPNGGIPSFKVEETLRNGTKAIIQEKRRTNLMRYTHRPIGGKQSTNSGREFGVSLWIRREIVSLSKKNS